MIIADPALVPWAVFLALAYHWPVPVPIIRRTEAPLPFISNADLEELATAIEAQLHERLGLS